MVNAEKSSSMAKANSWASATESEYRRMHDRRVFSSSSNVTNELGSLDQASDHGYHG